MQKIIFAVENLWMRSGFQARNTKLLRILPGLSDYLERLLEGSPLFASPFQVPDGARFTDGTNVSIKYNLRRFIVVETGNVETIREHMKPIPRHTSMGEWLVSGSGRISPERRIELQQRAERDANPRELWRSSTGAEIRAIQNGHFRRNAS